MLGNRSAYAIMKRIMSQLVDYNASDVVFGAGHSSDTKDWLAAGVPGVELESANEKYFYFHHSHGKLSLFFITGEGSTAQQVRHKIPK